MNSGCFANRPYRGTGDDPRARAGRQQHDIGGTEVPDDRMGDRASLEWHIDQTTRAVFNRLFDRRRNFIGFAVSAADFAASIADDDHAIEAEAAAPFTTAAQRRILMTFSIKSPERDDSAIGYASG